MLQFYILFICAIHTMKIKVVIQTVLFINQELELYEKKNTKPLLDKLTMDIHQLNKNASAN